MRQKLKSLISSVEFLGLDTQPMRDLLMSNDVNIEDYAGKISSLEREVTKYPAGSQPQQVQILVKHLRPLPKEAKFASKSVQLTADNYIIQKNESKLDPDLVNTIQKLGLLVDHLSSQPPPQPQKVVDPNSEVLLEKLDRLSEKVDNMKGRAAANDLSLPDDLPKMQEAFVNPLDDRETEKLKGNVHIEPKTGKSLTSSLRKLRDLKKQ